MKDEIISFETAKILHEKGFFHYEIHSWYTPKGELIISSTRGIDFNFSGGIPAPSQSLLQKVLREKFHIDIMIEPFFAGEEEMETIYEPTIFSENLKMNKMIAFFLHTRKHWNLH